MSEISVIIPTMKGREALLNKLLLSLPGDVETIIVDDERLLLAAKRNKGAKRAKGRYLLFVDDDNYLSTDALLKMARFQERVGVVGMTACYDDKKLRIADGGSNRNYLSGFTSGQRTNARLWEVGKNCYEVDEVANAFMVRRDLFEQLGGFDEVNFPIDLDEADFCKRAKDAGYLVIMNPEAICYHKSQTYSHIPDFRRPMNAYFMGRNRILYQKKHLPAWKLAIYFVVFFPIFYLSYCACLLYRGKPGMIWHFSKGVFDGIFGRFKNQFQQG